LPLEFLDLRLESAILSDQLFLRWPDPSGRVAIHSFSRRDHIGYKTKIQLAG
jgi:hypothetical protein